MSKLSRSNSSKKTHPQISCASSKRITGSVRLPLLLPKPASSIATSVAASSNATGRANKAKSRRRKTIKTDILERSTTLNIEPALLSSASESNFTNGGSQGPFHATEALGHTMLSGAEYQANYEEFVRTFAVPTHLYRYLASRHRARPTYLTRNLRYMHPTRRRSDRKRETLEQVVARLSSTEVVKSFGTSRSKRSVKSGTNMSTITSNGHPLEHQWPDEIEIIMEGLFDSEEENDWVTVKSSVNLFCRVAWSWRRRFCPLDSLVLVSSDVACACNSEPLSSTTSTRFRVIDMLRAAAALDNSPSSETLLSTICSRINSAQLELQVHVIERRRARHINGSEAGEPLGHTAYPVVYSTSLLPLFFAPEPGWTASSFLLTPGLYELRLGIQAAPIQIPEECGSLPVALPSKSIMALEGGTPTAANGDHRLSFQSSSSAASSRFLKGVPCAALNEYSRWPRLRFRVVWRSVLASSPYPISVPKQHAVKGAKGPIKRLPSELEGSPPSKMLKLQLQEEVIKIEVDENDEESNNSISNSKSNSSTSNSIDVVYLFFYGGDEKRILQWTKTRDMICPWCKLDCRQGDKVYPSCLMAHLRCCHPRFRFCGSWQRETNHLVLEVTLDESYDGSNDCVPRTYRPTTVSEPDSGMDICLAETAASRNPYHLPLVGGWTGYCGEVENNLRDARKLATFRFLQRRRQQPLKRLSFSQLIYWRGVERFSGSCQEVTGEIASISAMSSAAMAMAVSCPLEVGHKRAYFHTTTLQAIEPTAFDDCDPEDQDAPQWLRDHYQRKVEEFTDVNKGEKEFMQIWNAFLLSILPSEVVVCDNQMGALLLMFVQRHGARLHRHRLRTNFILHLANLYDYGLISPSLMRKVTCVFDDLTPSSC